MRQALRLFLLHLVAAGFAVGAASVRGDEAKAVSYRAVVVSSTRILVRVNPESVLTISVKEAGEDSVAPATFMPVEPRSQWILATVGGGMKFEPKKQYVLTLTMSDGKDKAKIASVASLIVDTGPKVKLAKSQSGLTTIESSVAFSLKGSNAILSNNAHFCRSGQVVRVIGRDPSNRAIYFKGSSVPLAESSLCEIDESKLDDLPDANGIGMLALGKSELARNIVSLTGVLKGKIVNVFGDDLTFDQKDDGTAVQPAPQKKEDAWLWVNGTVTAGTGAAPAWVLDGLVTAPMWQYWWGGVPITPVTVSANIGNNKIGGVAAKDVIDFEIPSLMWLPPVISDDLRLQVPASLTFETNRAFTHRNLLGVGDVIWDLRALNQSQAVRTAERAAGKEPFKMPPQGRFGKGGYESVGWMLQFHTGFEAGGALATATVTNPKTKATIGVLPTYSIARLVPQIDGLFQVREFSLESFLTGRYLFTTEHTAVNNNAGIPYLETVSGWKAVNVLTFTYAPGQSPHIKFNVAYTEGFAAPTYQRANGVKIGLAVAY